MQKTIVFENGHKSLVDDRVFELVSRLQTQTKSTEPRQLQRKVIANLCRGDCVEIGALSAPAYFPHATSVLYADVVSAEEAKRSLEKIGYLGYHQRPFVAVDVIFDKQKPPLISLASDSKDCIFSSHSLEHSPNPIAALSDYLRVLKHGGIVYSIIPNKKYTYDRFRLPTKINKLIEKFKRNDWSYTLDEYRDVFVNTDTHVVYDNSTEEDIERAFEENNGHHHIYVYEEKNTLELIHFLAIKTGCELTYFDSSNHHDIHFAIRANKKA